MHFLQVIAAAQSQAGKSKREQITIDVTLEYTLCDLEIDAPGAKMDPFSVLWEIFPASCAALKKFNHPALV